MGVVLFGVGVGVGLAMWSQRPTLVDAQPEAFVLFALVVLALAWFGGRRQAARASAVAVAQARADARAASESTSSAGAVAGVNVYVGTDRVQGEQLLAGLEAADWRGERSVEAEMLAQLEERAASDGIEGLRVEAGDLEPTGGQDE